MVSVDVLEMVLSSRSNVLLGASSVVIVARVILIAVLRPPVLYYSAPYAPSRSRLSSSSKLVGAVLVLVYRLPHAVQWLFVDLSETSPAERRRKHQVGVRRCSHGTGARRRRETARPNLTPKMYIWNRIKCTR